MKEKRGGKTSCVILSSFWSKTLITLHPKHSYNVALWTMIMFLPNPCGNDITREIMMEGVFQYLNEW